MEVTLLSPNSIKIKGKKASVVVDPKPKMPKTSADGVIVLSEGEMDMARVEEQRLVIKEPGEYEVGGFKVDGEEKFYKLVVDNSSILLARVSALGANTDAGEAETAILNVDSDLDEALVASLESKVIILYGDKAEVGLKALGKDIAPLKKFASKEKTEDSETQIIWLA